MKIVAVLIAGLFLLTSCGSENQTAESSGNDTIKNTPPPPREVKVLDLEKQPLPDIKPGEGGLSSQEASDAIKNLPEVANELAQAPPGSTRKLVVEQEASETERWYYIKCVEEMENGVKQNFFRFRIQADEGDIEGYYKPTAEYLPLADWRAKMNPVQHTESN